MSFAFFPQGNFTPTIVTQRLEQIVGAVPARINFFYGTLVTNSTAVNGIGNSSNIGLNARKTLNGAFTVFPWVDLTNSDLWFLDNSTIGTGIIAPDGSPNAQKIITSTSNTTHSVGRNGTLGGGAVLGCMTPTIWRIAIIAKPDGYTRCVIDHRLLSGPANATLTFGMDLAGGNIGYDTSHGTSITIVAQNATPIVANGSTWYLMTLDFYFNNNVVYGNNGVGGAAAPTWGPQIFVDNGTGTGARSTTFTGDGVSGIDVWWFSILPQQAWQLTNLVFNAEFDNVATDVDINNTKAPGFRFYPNSLFTNTLYTSFWNNVRQGSMDPRAIIQKSAGVLGIEDNYDLPPGNSRAQMYSIAQTTGSGFVGSAFYGPQYAEDFSCARGSIDPGIQPSNDMNLSRYSAEAIIGSGLNPLSNYRFMEWDHHEYGTGTDSGGTAECTAVSAEWRNPPSPFLGVDDAPGGGADYVNMRVGPQSFQRLSGLWINAFSNNNGGWGHKFSFLNGVLGADTCNSLGGDFAISDSHHMVLNTGAGIFGFSLGGFSAYIYQDWVKLWQMAVTPIPYSFWNVVDKGTDLVVDAMYTPGLKLTKPSGTAQWETIRCAHGKLSSRSGKWYWEITINGDIGTTNGLTIGICNAGATVSNNLPGGTAKGAGLQYNTAANTNVNGITGDYTGSVTWTTNDVIGFALDLGAGKCWIHKNGTWLNGTPGAGTDVWSGISADTWFAAAAIHDTGATESITANFGQSSFAFTLPTGYSGWTASYQDGGPLDR